MQPETSVLVLFLFLIHLTSVLCLGQDDCATTATFVDKEGKILEKDCVFPFIVNNETFYSCTEKFEDSGKPWCSLKVDRDGFHVDGMKGFCRSPCRPHAAETRMKSKRSADCLTKKGPCVFPFVFLGKVYYDCTLDHASDGKPWCSIKVNSKGQHINSYWGHCFCSTPSRPFFKDCPAPHLNTLTKASENGSYLPVDDDGGFVCGRQRLLKLNPTQIIGGTPTALQEFPFAVLLVYYDLSGNKKYLCGGSLINRRYVLTAAHCMEKKDPSQVLIGDYDLSEKCDCVDNLCAPQPQEILIDEIIVHEGYNGNKRHKHELVVNDIALIRLAFLVDLNPGVGTVCLPLTDDTAPELVGEEVTVVGWGKTEHFSASRFLEELGVSSPILQKVSIPVVSHQACSDAWKSLGRVKASHLCAGKPGFDSCRGDSGGPLIYRTDPDSPWYLRGVVSFGSPTCGDDQVAVYTRVEKYIEWIRDNLRP